MSTLAKLDTYSEQGRKLLRMDDAEEAHAEFGEWVRAVERWLKKTLPNTGAVANWLSLGESQLGIDDGTYDDVMVIHFRKVVGDRLKWLSVLPSRIRSRPHSNAASDSVPNERRATQVMQKNRYVDPSRIHELRAIKSAKFDVAKLVRLCEELNLSLESNCYFSMIMLTRSIIDHVPPIFGCSKFSEVANNYAGAKSFRGSVHHLENSSRKIADQHLHGQIRKSETLPTSTQVNFSNDLDVLLGEIVRILK